MGSYIIRISSSISLTDNNTYTNNSTINLPSHNMEQGMEQRLTDVYKSDIVKNIISVVSKISLITGQKFTITISYNNGVSVVISRSKLTAIAYIHIDVCTDKKVIINEDYDILGSFLLPDNVYTEDLDKLIRNVVVVNIENIEQYKDIKHLVVSLCKKQIKIAKELIDQEYKKRIDNLYRTFLCTIGREDDDDYERTERMQVNYDAYDRWILTQKGNEGWVIIQNGEVCGVGKDRKDAYKEADKNPKYVPSEDVLAATINE